MINHDIALIDGGTTTLADYKGKAVLLVNVASKCGYTPQYEGLEALHNKLKDQGLVVLGVPCNDFGGQEPGSEQEIWDFCSSTYGVTFPLAAKAGVLGDHAHPVYQDLRSMEPPIGGDVRWNFTKFLIGADGRVIGRYEPDTRPDSRVLRADISAALASA